MTRGMYLKYGKRMLDLVLCVTTLPFLMPLMAFLAVVARVKLGSPVLFRQDRPGRNGEPFVLLKFRTMTDARDSDGQLLPDKKRLTSFGRFLRSTSLDELPEIFNVLKGDMSLVGPRPLLIRYQPYYLEHERKRFEVSPGITGWAQVNGRNAVPWNERLRFDVWYAENVSFGLDLKILAVTIFQALRHHGVETDPSSIMLDLDDERTRNGRSSCLRPD